MCEASRDSHNSSAFPWTLSTLVALFVKRKHLTSLQSSRRAGVANHKPSAWKENELSSRETQLHTTDALFSLRTATPLELVHFSLHKYCKQSSKWVVKQVIQLCTVHFSGKNCTSILPEPRSSLFPSQIYWLPIPELLLISPRCAACSWLISKATIKRCLLPSLSLWVGVVRVCGGRVPN